MYICVINVYRRSLKFHFFIPFSHAGYIGAFFAQFVPVTLVFYTVVFILFYLSLCTFEQNHLKAA